MSTPVVECSSCAFLTEETRCSLREIKLEDPERSFCVSHDSYTRKADRVPVGPVYGIGEVYSVLHPSPDNEPVRRHLIEMVGDVDVASASDLTLRQTVALWQVNEFRERRAYVHVDRISAAISTPAARLDPLGVMLAKGIFERIAGEDAAQQQDDLLFLERLTIGGRALLFCSLVVGVAAFYAAFVFLYENAPGGTPIPLLVLAILALLTGAAFLALGVFVFRRMGIPFWVAEKAQA